MEINLLNDLSVLTTIPEYQLNQLKLLSEQIICHNVLETLKENNDVCKIDIGIGKLIFQLSNDELVYKFIPEKNFEESIVDTILNGTDLLQDTIENRTCERMLKVYKDLI